MQTTPLAMLNYFLLLVVFFANLNHIYGYNEQRIKNGVKTPPNLFQFAVRLRTGATGTIISKRHVLTCGHCVDVVDKYIKHEKYQVAQHTYVIDFRDGVEPVDYKMINGSKAYLPIHFYPSNDLAIIEYPEGTNLGVTPVKLAKDYIEKEGDEAFIAGFGALGRKENREPNDFYYTNVTMITDCSGTLKICGGNETHRSLGGDSGGPMLIKRNNQWYQVGVASRGGAFDTRVRVSSYCDFIEEMTKNEVKCELIYPENHYNDSLLPIKHFEPIYKGQATPIKLFNFIVPLYNYYYNQGCSATVISKRHLLTSVWCVYRQWLKNQNKKIHFIEHSSYKTITGKLFPDLRSTCAHLKFIDDPINVTAYFPSNYVLPWKHNIAVIEFPEGTDFGIEPVALPKDYFQIYLKNEVIIAGYGKYKIKNNMHLTSSPPMLQHSNATFALRADWKITLKNNDNLVKDEGGPILIDQNGKFYQIGVNFHQGTHNGSRTPVSSHCDFIEEVTNKEVKCESVLPIYEKPPSESITTILPENLVEPSEAPFIPKPKNDNPISLFLKKIFFFWRHY